MRRPYSEKLIVAVEYLMEKGITKDREIAERLGVSPHTVKTIKFMLKKRSMGEAKKAEPKREEKEAEEGKQKRRDEEEIWSQITAYLKGELGR